MLLIILLTGLGSAAMAMAPVPNMLPMAFYAAPVKPTYAVTKTLLNQGESTEVLIKDPALTAKRLYIEFAGQRVPMFSQQGEGHWWGAVAASPLEQPGEYPLVVKDDQGSILSEKIVKVQDANFKKQYITVSKATASLQPEPGEIEAIRKFKATASPTRFWDSQFIAPVPQCMNSLFGSRRYYNGEFSGSYHKGVDQRSPQGQVIKAPSSGKVSLAKYYQLHGGTVGLDHGQGLTSIYIHLDRIDVQPGQIVHQGDPIGLVGSTGFASGPHLHWGIYVHGVPVNPLGWVPLPSC